jgi:hypothetical protein
MQCSASTDEQRPDGRQIFGGLRIRRETMLDRKISIAKKTLF